MPTPFYHLKVAQDILSSASVDSDLRRFLQEFRAPFLFGNVAPDVQTISKQPRAETHFFDFPISQNQYFPWDRLLRTHPQLISSSTNQPAWIAFLCGYLCHLQADWMWVSQVFVPVFGLHSVWGTFSQRLTLHNVLRAYLDREMIQKLSTFHAEDIAHVKPETWLPFVADQHLFAWRDFLASQLQPGGKIYTVEVFAERQGVTPEQYHRIMESEEDMEREIFAHLPKDTLRAFYEQLLQNNTRLLGDYLLFSPYKIQVKDMTYENNR